jgi:hypothetical protein
VTLRDAHSWRRRQCHRVHRRNHALPEQRVWRCIGCCGRRVRQCLIDLTKQQADGPGHGVIDAGKPAIIHCRLDRAVRVVGNWIVMRECFLWVPRYHACPVLPNDSEPTRGDQRGGRVQPPCPASLLLLEPYPECRFPLLFSKHSDGRAVTTRPATLSTENRRPTKGSIKVLTIGIASPFQRRPVAVSAWITAETVGKPLLRRVTVSAWTVFPAVSASPFQRG